MLGRAIAIITLLSVVLLSAILQSTSPSTSHPLVILFVFALIYMSVLGVLTFLLFSLGRLLKRILPQHYAFHTPVSVERAYYYASVIALIPVLYLGMSSVGSVGIYEITLIALFEIVACIYIMRRK